MKKFLLTVSAALTLLISISTFADTTTTTAAPGGAMTEGSGTGAPGMAQGNSASGMKNNPAHQACKHIFMACKAAGYSRGGAASGKGIMENCAQPIMAGQTVAGVQVDPADVATCKSVHNHNMPH